LINWKLLHLSPRGPLVDKEIKRAYMHGMRWQLLAHP
jgi:hypothetical protein